MRIKLLSMILVVLALQGCTSNVSLQEVRDFADESARLSAYSELSNRFRDTYKREKPYLSPGAEQLAKENDAKRQAAYPDIVKIQRSVVLYMQTLGALAGEDQFDVLDQDKALGDGIKTLPMAGIEQRHVQAYSGLARLLTRAATLRYQGQAVQSMVRDGDRDLQTMIEAMVNLVRYYDKTNANEKKTVLGVLEVEIPFTDKSRERLLTVLARVHQQQKINEYQLIDRRFTLAEKGLTIVATGHRKMLENLDQMDNAEVRKVLRGFWRDLRDIHEHIKSDPT